MVGGMIREKGAPNHLQRSGIMTIFLLLSLVSLVLCDGTGDQPTSLFEVPSNKAVNSIEETLKTLEQKLNDVGPTPEHVAWQKYHNVPTTTTSDVSGDADELMHASPIDEHLFNWSTQPTKDGKPQRWTAADQVEFDKHMTRALGFSGPAPPEQHVPAMFLPLASLPLQKTYAHNLVRVLQDMKAGYVDELISWAVSGRKGENPYIVPIVQALEAPLIKDLDQEAHAKVASTVAAVARRRNLTPSEMKSMRARLLVPLLLRIRARVHQQVQTYVVTMIRRIILYSVHSKGGSSPLGSAQSILAPESGEGPHASEDDHMEYTLRDIDALYERGVLSKKDYEAEKAKLLSDWLGLAIKHIGGQKKARKALEDFLWPPTYTVQGCRCMFPFKFRVKQLDGRTITYDECSDIPHPGDANSTDSLATAGKAWCAVDPDEGDCGRTTQDSLAFIGEGGYGWTRWDVCRFQPPEREPGVAVVAAPDVKVFTEQGCTCKLPFELFPRTLGGRIAVTQGVCTREGGEAADWCATEGKCGNEGQPSGLAPPNKPLSWTHWDRCIGEPAGYLAGPPRRIRTRQGCTCRLLWAYKPRYLKHTMSYGGCTDADRPGEAWCAVDEDDCGEAPEVSVDGLGWKRWVTSASFLAARVNTLFDYPTPASFR